ncbi:hypothetical protein Hamer_G000512 [Homarus americanus]|uniref:Uncharacterized protein n=1 Tax=Homarus americanus TaxID=6706 RepID=A0A8J5TU21_HOMAM|nr:hypothetical protein Hamer_G000512 [Homarus americanus]
MGSNQVKTAAPSLMLPAESRALSCQDDQERQIRKGLPRRLGSMILSHWILMKRREQAILDKARQAVKDGRAPPEVLQKIEKQVAKGNRKRHIKYHPKILTPKPARPRLKAPKLTNTAARRIQAAFQRREKEQQPTTKITKKQTRSQINIKSQGWTENTPSRSKQTVGVRRKRSSSVPPPNSNLSLQSITTAESSGIGMSRASSMTSVASSKNKTLYTRQRELKERHGKSKTSRGISSSTPSIQRLGETSGRHKCQTSQQNAQEREQSNQREKKQTKRKLRIQKDRDVLSDQQQKPNEQQTTVQQISQKTQNQQQTSQHQRGERQQQYRHLQTNKQKLQSQKQNDEQPLQKQVNVAHLTVTRGDREESSGEVEYRYLSVQPVVNEPQSPNSQVSGDLTPHRRQQQKEKKDQGSQTRVSGPSRPRRLLPTQHLRNRGARVGQGEEQQSRKQVNEQLMSIENPNQDESSSPQQIYQVTVHEKNVSVSVQSEAQEQPQQQQELRRTSASSQKRNEDLQPLPERTRQASADKNRTPNVDKEEQGRQHEPLLQKERKRSSENLQQDVRHEKIIQVYRHQVVLHSGDVSQSRQQPHQANDPQESNQQNLQQEQSQDRPEGEERSMRETKLTKQQREILDPKRSESRAEDTHGQEVFKQVKEDKRTVESRGGGRFAKLLGRIRNGRSSENVLTIASQSESRPGRSSEQSQVAESQARRRSGGSLERVRTVESQGGGRLGRLLGRGRAVESQDERLSRRSIERRRSSSSVDSGPTRTSLEYRHAGTSFDGARQRQSVDLGSPERVHRPHLVEPAPTDVPAERERYDALSQQVHRDLPKERVHLERSRERISRRPSIEQIRHDPLRENFRSEPPIQPPRPELLTGYAHREHLVEYTRHDPSTERVRREIRVTQEPLLEGSRTSSPAYRGRTLSYVEGRRRNSVVQVDRGYTSDASEPGYVRSYERRHNGGLAESSQTGASTARSLEPTYMRSYRRYVEPDYSRTYSEHGYGGRSVDQDYTRAYPERIVNLNESRWRSTDEWENGESRSTCVIAGNQRAAATLALPQSFQL